MGQLKWFIFSILFIGIYNVVYAQSILEQDIIISKRIINNKFSHLSYSHEAMAALTELLRKYEENQSLCFFNNINEIDFKLKVFSRKTLLSSIDQLYLSKTIDDVVHLSLSHYVKNRKTLKTLGKLKLQEQFDSCLFLDKVHFFFSDENKQKFGTKSIKNVLLSKNIITKEEYNALGSNSFLSAVKKQLDPFSYFTKLITLDHVRGYKFNFSSLAFTQKFYITKLSEVERTKEEMNYIDLLYLKKKNLKYDLFLNDSIEKIISYSKVLENVSKRLTSNDTLITFNYADGNENYVLSPMENYKLSMRMLENDLFNVVRITGLNYEQKNIYYRKAVLAFYLRGHLSLDELKFILNYEEFWNPHNPKWKKWGQFIVAFGQVGSYFLPPPFNLIASGGLALISSNFFKEKRPKKEKDNENYNSIF